MVGWVSLDGYFLLLVERWEMIYFSIFISIFCIIQGVVGSLLVSGKKIKSSMASDILIIGSIGIGIIGLIVIGAVK